MHVNYDVHMMIEPDRFLTMPCMLKKINSVYTRIDIK